MTSYSTLTSTLTSLMCWRASQASFVPQLLPARLLSCCTQFFGLNSAIYLIYSNFILYQFDWFLDCCLIFVLKDMYIRYIYNLIASTRQKEMKIKDMIGPIVPLTSMIAFRLVSRPAPASEEGADLVDVEGCYTCFEVYSSNAVLYLK